MCFYYYLTSIQSTVGIFSTFFHTYMHKYTYRVQRNFNLTLAYTVLTNFVLMFVSVNKSNTVALKLLFEQI